LLCQGQVDEKTGISMLRAGLGGGCYPPQGDELGHAMRTNRVVWEPVANMVAKPVITAVLLFLCASAIGQSIPRSAAIYGPRSKNHAARN
jgi:hypothetical protein